MYRERRERLVIDDTLLLLRTSSQRCPDAAYLGGLCAGEEQVLAITAEAAILFLPEPDAHHDHWYGARPSWEDVASCAEVADVRPLWALERDLAALLRGRRRLAWSMGRDATWDARLMARVEGRDVVTSRSLTRGLRVRKDAGELEKMRIAGRATAAAHEEVLGLAAPGMTDFELAAMYRAALARRGLSEDAFDGIFATGPQSTCLHPPQTGRALRAGEFLMIDAGGGHEGYAADMTRARVIGTPATAAQADLHEVVQGAHAAALARCAPDARLEDLHDAALEALATGIRALGFVGDVTQWFTHRTSHFVGLEVHDPGDRSTKLEDGVVFTIEPGLYVAEDDERAPAAFRGLGIRHEDTVAMVGGVAEVLTAS